MDKFKTGGSISNQKTDFYNTILLKKSEVSEIIDTLQNKKLLLNKEKMQEYNRFLVQLFAFTFDINVPYCEVHVDEKDNHYHDYFVFPSSGFIPLLYLMKCLLLIRSTTV